MFMYVHVYIHVYLAGGDSRLQALCCISDPLPHGRVVSKASLLTCLALL